MTAEEQDRKTQEFTNNLIAVVAVLLALYFGIMIGWNLREKVFVQYYQQEIKQYREVK